MKRQSGLSLISTMIIGVILVAILILGFRIVPVYSEYYSVQKAFAGVLDSTDKAAQPSVYRNNFMRFSDVGDLRSVDSKAIDITKSNGQVTMQVSYRRELPLFANVGLYFDFDVSVTK